MNICKMNLYMRSMAANKLFSIFGSHWAVEDRAVETQITKLVRERYCVIVTFASGYFFVRLLVLLVPHQVENKECIDLVAREPLEL